MVFTSLYLLRWQQECVDDMTVGANLDRLKVLLMPWYTLFTHKLDLLLMRENELMSWLDLAIACRSRSRMRLIVISAISVEWFKVGAVASCVTVPTADQKRLRQCSDDLKFDRGIFIGVARALRRNHMFKLWVVYCLELLRVLNLVALMMVTSCRDKVWNNGLTIDEPTHFHSFESDLAFESLSAGTSRSLFKLISCGPWFDQNELVLLLWLIRGQPELLAELVLLRGCVYWRVKFAWLLAFTHDKLAGVKICAWSAAFVKVRAVAQWCCRWRHGWVSSGNADSSIRFQWRCYLL